MNINQKSISPRMVVCAVAILASLLLQIFRQMRAIKPDWFAPVCTFVALVIICLNIRREKSEQ
jgi:preprotein translocase subunit Sec61beta